MMKKLKVSRVHLRSVGITTIKLEPATRVRLANLGRKGDTYDQIINCLIDHYEGKRKKR